MPKKKDTAFEAYNRAILNPSLFTADAAVVASFLNTLAADCRKQNDQWWRHFATGRLKKRNDGELIALMHSELSEALEGVRKNLNDDKLPHRPMVEVEMADCIIRILDYCAARKLNVGWALVEKAAFNAVRADHKHSNRKGKHGKKF